MEISPGPFDLESKFEPLNYMYDCNIKKNIFFRTWLVMTLQMTLTSCCAVRVIGVYGLFHDLKKNML